MAAAPFRSSSNTTPLTMQSRSCGQRRKEGIATALPHPRCVLSSIAGSDTPKGELYGKSFREEGDGIPTRRRGVSGGGYARAARDLLSEARAGRTALRSPHNDHRNAWQWEDYASAIVPVHELRTLLRNRGMNSYKPLIDTLTACAAIEEERPTLI